MTGLGVLLETTTVQQKQLLLRPAAAARTPAQVISKATLTTAAAAAARTDVHGASSASSGRPSSSSRSPMAVPAAASCCSFLQRCFLCHRELADGRDIYIYRGDRAFCSEECRCRHILVDESGDGAMNCARGAAATRSRRRRQAITGGFAF